VKFNKPITELVFTGHAIQQMFARRITVDEVREVIANHEIIVEYPDDVPYPSNLLLGGVSGRPLHVVLGYDNVRGNGYVITVYEPDPTLWDEKFRKRRTP
jgi:hypothetical protein